MIRTLCVLATLSTPAAPETDPGVTEWWGFTGHEMAARAAAAILPASMPVFFRGASERLAYLGAEPDRWRGSAVEMNEAWRYDHYVDLENLPTGALNAPDRFTYFEILVDAGLEEPARDGGFLPYRIVELYQRLADGWRRWRTETDPVRRGWIEQRIIDDAGILGHYVTDGSQPHHTTIHFDGWDARTPNPAGYTTERGFHGRFEADYVRARVTATDVAGLMPTAPRSVENDVRNAVLGFLSDSHAHVEELYRIDRDVGFDPQGPVRPEARDFAAARLADGAAMLASLWWSAWLEALEP